MTEQQIPFGERFAIMQKIALMRLGSLGNPDPMGGHALSSHLDAYKAFGITLPDPPYKFGFRPSLVGARCPKCHTELELGEVQSDYGIRFDGTDGEGESFQFAAAWLRCPKSEKHLDSIRYYSTRVSLDGTIAELLPEIEKIADELGESSPGTGELRRRVDVVPQA